MALSFDAWKAGAVRPATVDVPVRVLQAPQSPQLEATLQGQGDLVWQVAWSPDGKSLASLSIEHSQVKLWDVARRQVRATLRSDLGNSYGLAFTPDGKRLALAHYRVDRKTGRTGGISLWDVATGRRTALLQHASPRSVARLALSPDGKRIAATESWAADDKGSIRQALTLWDLSGGKHLRDLAEGSAPALTFSPDGKVLAWSTYAVKDKRIAESLVGRRDLTTGQDLPPLAHPGGRAPLNCLAWSADGRTIAASDFAGSVVLWNAASGKVRAHWKVDGERRVQSLAFSPDGKWLAAGLGDRQGQDHDPGLIVLYDVAGKQRLVLHGHTQAVLSVAFSPDGKHLASGGTDRTVRLWAVSAVPAADQKAAVRSQDQ